MNTTISLRGSARPAAIERTGGALADIQSRAVNAPGRAGTTPCGEAGARSDCGGNSPTGQGCLS